MPTSKPPAKPPAKTSVKAARTPAKAPQAAAAKPRANKPAAAPAKPPATPAKSPEEVAADLQKTLAMMDSLMKRVSDAADKAAVRLAVSMGADEAQVGALVERQAEAKARKAAAQKGQPPAAQNGAPPAAPPMPAPKKKGWQAPQDAKTREKALKDGCPPCAPPLERCWHCFPNLPPAGAWDWLGKDQPGVRDRPGQPIKRFLQPGPHRSFPTRVCRKIYLLPLGDVSGAPAPAVLTELLRLWFCLEVELMKLLPAKALAAIERDEDGCGYGAQIECPSAQKVIHAHKPRDAFIVIGYTMEDLCNSSSGFGFLFGEANLDLSIGLFSFARYADDVPRSSPRFLRRCCPGSRQCGSLQHRATTGHPPARRACRLAQSDGWPLLGRCEPPRRPE